MAVKDRTVHGTFTADEIREVWAILTAYLPADQGAEVAA